MLKADLRRIHVLIVDDDRLFADATAIFLQDQEVGAVDVTSDPSVALEIVRTREPDLVLLEIALGRGSGLALAAEIKAAGRGIKVVALTRTSDRIMRASAVRVGLHGFISKDLRPARLLPSILDVLKGASTLTWREDEEISFPSGDILNSLLETQLTPREKQILGLIVEGLSSKDITLTLGLTLNTVRTHIQSLMRKLHVHSRVEAAAFATKHQLV